MKFASGNPAKSVREWRESQSVEQLRKDLQARNEAESRLRQRIARMRQQECPWSVIGEALGISKQTAYNRYGALRVSTIDRPLDTPEDHT